MTLLFRSEWKQDCHFDDEKHRQIEAALVTHLLRPMFAEFWCISEISKKYFLGKSIDYVFCEVKMALSLGLVPTGAVAAGIAGFGGRGLAHFRDCQRRARSGPFSISWLVRLASLPMTADDPQLPLDPAPPQRRLPT